MNLIEAKDLKKSYKMGFVETSVLKGVSLTLGEKSVSAIVGASGAGKSTLLHILGSLDKPSSGIVLFDGEDLYRRKDEDLSRLRNRAIGFVFQFHYLMPEFTALENVMMPLLVRGDPSNEARRLSLELLERLGLKERALHRPSELSGGEQQRVAVARALITTPRILMADEPTGNLDQENGEKLIDLFFELQRERGMALILVTHNFAIASRFPRRITLEDGLIERIEVR